MSSTDEPPAGEENDPAAGQNRLAQNQLAQNQLALNGLDDEGLLAALRDLLSHDEPPPGWVVDLAKSSYGFRNADAELAALVSDSAAAAATAVRASGPARLAVFGTSDLSVEIEIEPGARADSWRLIGQLTPAGPARIQVRQRMRAAPVSVVADDLGRFVVDRLLAGPLSLVCSRSGTSDAVTEWIAVGLRPQPFWRY